MPRGPEQLEVVMTLEALREMRDTAPFRPSEIHLADGRVLPVVTTDHLLFLPDRPEFVVVLPDGVFRIVDPSQVVSARRNPAQARTS
jgi:hypothetical protein